MPVLPGAVPRMHARTPAQQDARGTHARLQILCDAHSCRLADMSKEQQLQQPSTHLLTEAQRDHGLVSAVDAMRFVPELLLLDAQLHFTSRVEKVRSSLPYDANECKIALRACVSGVPAVGSANGATHLQLQVAALPPALRTSVISKVQQAECALAAPDRQACSRRAVAGL